MPVPLNLPPVQLKCQSGQVWDILRRRYVKQTPEEWVRQHLIHYLINHLNYPLGLMQSEYTLKYNNMAKRCDIILFSKQTKPILIVECKAPSVPITADTFYQISRYHQATKAPVLILSNGLNHVIALVNHENGNISYLEEIPEYTALCNLLNA